MRLPYITARVARYHPRKYWTDKASGDFPQWDPGAKPQ